MDTRSRQVLAFGTQAWEMIGRTPGHVVAIRPLRHGAITDFDVTERLIRLVMSSVVSRRFNFGKPRVLVCVPASITPVERRAVEEATMRAGAKSVYLIKQPLAAAMGASLPINEPLGSMIVDMGGGTTEVAVISLGGIVTLNALRLGGFDLDASIQALVRKEFGVAIGERTAEEIKCTVGSANKMNGSKIEVRGRDLVAGVPRSIVVTTEEVYAAIKDPLEQSITAVLNCLSSAPPELAQDLMVGGMVLTGGGSLLDGFAERLQAEAQVQVRVADSPLEAVARGAGWALDSFDLVREILMQ